MNGFCYKILPSFVVLFVLTDGAPSDWNGVFEDLVFGGEVRVCTSYISSSGIYYGQGKFSDLGYMRGEISAADDTWTGEFWMAGREGRHGTFTLSLIDTSGVISFSGNFVEAPGISYAMSGNQNSTVEPEASLCFKSDDSLLDGTSSFSFDGVWFKPVGLGVRNMFTEGGNIISSYTYGATSNPGFNRGPVSSNGLVYSSNWYEGGDYEGMYLFVAKNVSTFYSLWWWFDSVTDFDYTYRNDPNYYGEGENYIDTSKRAKSSSAHASECLELSLVELEDGCLNPEQDDDDDEKEKERDRMLVSVLVVSCCVFIAVFLSLISQAFGFLGSKTPTPLARQGVDDNSSRQRGNSEL